MDLAALRQALERAEAAGDDRLLDQYLVAQGWARAAAVQDEILQHVEVDPVTGCWNWTSDLSADGYAMLGGSKAYRIAYEAFIGVIPPGFHVDHVCRNRSCVRAADPPHLEAVTPAENNRRAMTYVQKFPGEQVHHAAKRWCKQGHEYTPENTYRDKRGRRYCVECRRRWANEHRRRAGVPPRRPEFYVDVERFAQLRAEIPAEGFETISSSQAAELCGLPRGHFYSWRYRYPGVLEPVGTVIVRGPRPTLLFRRDEVELLVACRSHQHRIRHRKLSVGSTTVNT